MPQECLNVCRLLLPALCGIATLLAARGTIADDEVRFGRDVLPILSENCFACHGPDDSKRDSDLRLDSRESALAAISIESPDDSELLARITSEDPDTLMPPPSSHKKPLSTEQVAIIKRWIAEGAPWGKHWAFEQPVKVSPPGDASHPIDAFILARLRKEGLALSPPAPRHTLARRVSFDTLGLPPTPDEVDAFVKATTPDAYEQFVDRLLASEHFGERMAMWWLDAARYSDTDGFQADATRTNWPWRDWVVDSFNRNMPFDHFTIEQFSGDLLPNATSEQKLATCFHRNHMTNGEGGRDPEESRIDYVIDRVNTTGTVWLGLTLGCCQCHSHKYDPITQRDYYSLTAFFNSIDEDGKAGKAAKPYLEFKSSKVERAVAEAQQLVDERKQLVEASRAEAQTPFAAWFTEQTKRVQQGFQAWHPLIATTLESIEGTEFQQEADGAIQSTGPNPNQDDYQLTTPITLDRVTGIKLEVFPEPSRAEGGYTRNKSGHFILTDIKVQVRSKVSYQVRDISVASAVATHSDDPKKHGGYGKIEHVLDDDPRNGWSTREVDAKQTQTAIFALAEPLTLSPDEELIFEMRHRSTLGDANIARFRVSLTNQPGPTVNSLETSPLELLAAAKISSLDELNADLRQRLMDQFLADYEPYVVVKQAFDRAKNQLQETTDARKVDVMILKELKKPRESHVLVRGVWDQKGEPVKPDVPPAIASWNGDEAKSRLGLARWIVSKENPLTARVVVNHVWQMFFGAGLVRTTEDFGLLGERPSHPELLDWLAVDFVEHNWDVKRLVRLIVTSETYQQRSSVSADLLARDPANRLLARGARFRLPSWMLRDAALKSAGLLNTAIGGPPVRPYQPPGVWEEMFMGRFKYEPSDGAAQYRRTLYAFWRRAIAPTFLFDSAQRRVCEVRESRTNTPLQALTMLNDANYLSASRALAEQAIRVANDSGSRIGELTRLVLSRPPTDLEQKILSRELDRALAYYRAHPKDAETFLEQTNFQFRTKVQSAEPLDTGELAAMTLAASLTLNFDEALNHE
jgi:hypothetical protein